MYGAGITQFKKTHVLEGIYKQLEVQVPLLSNAPALKCASTCTPPPRLLTKSQRIQKERRKWVVGKQVYDIIDKLRLNHVVYTNDLKQNFIEVKRNIVIIQTYIDLRKDAKFNKLRTEQLHLVSLVYSTAMKRSKYMDKVDYYKDTVLSYLYKEVLLVDRVSELDVKIDQYCMQRGVSGAPFFEGGKLVEKVWGIIARSLFSEIGKD